jgi:tol-pal system protein YbgF
MSRFRAARLVPTLIFAIALVLPSAHAENKDMIQLQTQMQTLIDAVARLQQSNDERMGVMKDLVQQTADSMNRMAVVINGMKLQLQNVQDANAAKSDQLSGQIQSLNDSLDELKARMAKMDKALGEIQNQQQSTNAMLSNLPAAGSPVPAAPGATGTTKGPQPMPGPAPIVQQMPPAAAVDAPAVGDLYKAAYKDYIGGKYPLASSEFGDLIKAYPDDNLAGNAYFYIGEIDVRNQKLTAAVKSYDQVLERYPDNQKIPAAHLHKAFAMIAMKQADGGVRELRALIQRFPTSPEASQARAKLSSMRLPVTPREPQ